MPKSKLLEQVRDKIRTRGYSIRTETAYITWIKRFIYFHNKRHPRHLGKDEINRFFNHYENHCSWCKGENITRYYLVLLLLGNL